MRTNTHKCKLAILTKTYLRQRKRLRAHKLHHKIQQDRHAKSKAVHNNNAVPDKLQLEDILVSLPVGKVPGEIACRAQQKDDSSKNPERSIEVRIRFYFLYELSLDGDEGECDSFNNLLLTDSEVLFIELEVEEACASSRLLLFWLDVGLLLGLCRAVFILF